MLTTDRRVQRAVSGAPNAACTMPTAPADAAIAQVASPFNPAPQSVLGDTRCPMPISLRKQVAHPSHQTLFRESISVYYCQVCGCCAHDRLGNLAAECSYRLQGKGSEDLQRLERGPVPGTSARATVSHMVAWP